MRYITSTKEFIRQAKEIHGDKYDYSQVEYKRSNQKIKILCKKCGQYFWQTPHNHLQGSGCNNFHFRKKGGKKITTEDFIKKAKEIHGNKFDYSQVEYKNNRIKVKIICNNCGKIFEIMPSNFLYQRKDCLYCGNYKKLNKEEFIEKAKEIHGDKYDYSNINYINSSTKIKILCKKCNQYFWQTPQLHIKHNGCKKCDIKTKLNKEEFIEKAKEIHSDKYDYSNINYLGIMKKINIYCKKCNTFFSQRAKEHLEGCGCPNCYHSKGEDKIKRFLEENNIHYIFQKRFKDCKDKIPLPFDFYLPDYNICIEFQGKQHYREGINFFMYKRKSKEKGIESYKKQKFHDKIKKDYCKKNNILLLEIKYNDNIEQKLNEIVKKE